MFVFYAFVEYFDAFYLMSEVENITIPVTANLFEK